MAKKISELRNLGPACEADLNAIGVYSLDDINDLGIEATFLQWMTSKGDGKGFHAAYLYALYGAVHDVDWRDVPEKKKDEFKRLTAELRAESGK